jgi:hypothetical protein
MVYCVFEGKYSGEFAPGMGKNKTDLFIWHSGEAHIAVRKPSKTELEKMAYALQPRPFKR